MLVLPSNAKRHDTIPPRASALPDPRFIAVKAGTSPYEGLHTSPTTGSNVSGNMKVSVSATDNVRVARVELYVDGAFYSSSTSATAVFPWNTRKVGKGPHTLTARAVDDAGNIGTSSSVTVYK